MAAERVGWASDLSHQELAQGQPIRAGLDKAASGLFVSCAPACTDERLELRASCSRMAVSLAGRNFRRFVTECSEAGSAAELAIEEDGCLRVGKGGAWDLCNCRDRATICLSKVLRRADSDGGSGLGRER